MASESGEEDNSDPSFHLGAVMMDHCYSVLHEEYMRRFRLTEESESPKEEECDKSVEKLAPLPGSSSEQKVKGTDTDEQTVLSPHNEESEKQLKNDADEFLTEQTRDEENLDDTESKEDVHEKKNETEGFLEVPIQTRRQKKKLEEIMTGNLSPEKLGKDGFCKTAEADGAKLHSSNKETRPDLAKNQEEISHELPTTPKKRGRPRKNTVTNQKESEEKTDLKEDKTMPNSAETPSPRKRGRPRKSSLQLTVCEQTTVVPDKKTQMPSDAPTPIKKESQEEKYECQSEVEKLTETKELKQEDEVSSKKLEQKNKNLSSKPIDGKKMSESMHVEEYENEDDTTKVCFKHQTTKSKTKHQKRVDKKDIKSGDKDSTRKEESKTEKKQKEQTAESGQSKTKTTKRKVLRRESRTLSLEALSVEPSLFSNPDVMIKDSVGAHTENQSEPDTKLQTMPKIPLSTKKEDSEKSHDNTKLTCQADDKDEDSVTQSLKDRDILESRTNLQESEPPSLDKNQDPCESKSIEDSSSRQLRSTLEKKPSVESKKDTEKVETDLKDDKDNEKNTQECEKEYSKEDRKVANDDESGLDDSEESSDDDPDRLWCICRKPHNGRFMIGCDGCEEWFHGSCVGITRQKGQLMEKEEIEWLCPKCKEEQDSEVNRVKWTQTKEVEEESSDSEKTLKFIKKDDDKAVKKEELKTMKKDDDKAVKKDDNTVRKEDVKAMKKDLTKNDNAMKKDDVKAMKKDDIKAIKEDSKPVKKKDSKPVKKEDSKPVKKEDSKPVKKEDSKPVKKEDSKPVKKEDSKPVKREVVKNVKDEDFKNVKKDGVEVAQKEDDINAVKMEKHSITVKRVDIKSSKKEETINMKEELKSPVLYHSSPSSKPLDNTVKPRKKVDRKCVECKKLVTVPGIFCSMECLEKHVKESLEAITLERERKKEPPIKPSEHRILVLEHDSGKLLAGPHAPLAEHLLEWLTINPTFQILRPRHISIPKDSFIKKEGEQVKDDEGSTGPEPIRLNVRKTLLDCLSARLKTAEIFCVSSEEIKNIAVKIEEELFRYFKDTGSKYKAKYRSLVFNIKDQRNEGLFRKIVKSIISPEKLVRMSPGEMASKELVKWREQETKHMLEIIKREQMDQVNNPHHTKKTHKGEIEIEEENLVTLDQQKNFEKELVTSTLGTPVIMSADTASPGTPVDTTDQHRSHLFDLSCKICTGKVAPPPKEPVVKKVHVAHTIAVETKEKPSSTKTDLDIRIAEILRQGELEFVKERHKLSEKNKRKKDVLEEKSDQEPSSTVSFGSPDSGSTTLSSSSQIKPSRTQTSVWKGFIYMQDVAKFVTSAYKVSGPTDFLTQDIPDTVQVCGRVTQEQIWEYLGRTKQSGNKELIVIRFQPANDEEKVPYGAFYSYLNSRKRFGVVGNASKMIKDFYILPLPSYSPVPTVLMPFDGPGLSPSRAHILLGVIVRHKNRPLRQVSESHLHMENVDPYEPSYTPPLESFPNEKTPKFIDDHLNTFHTSSIKKRSRSDSSDPPHTPPVEKLSREDDFEDFAIGRSRENSFGVVQPIASCDRDKPETWKNQTSLTHSSSAPQFPNSVQTELEHSPVTSHHKEKLETEKNQVEQQSFQGTGHTLGTIQGSVNPSFQNVTCHQISAAPSLVTNSVCNSQQTVKSNIGSEQHSKKETTEGIDDVFTKLSSGLPPHLRTIIKAINKVTQQFTSGILTSQNVGQDAGKTSSMSESSSREKTSQVSVEESRQETPFHSDENKIHQSVSNILPTKVQDHRTRVQTTGNNVARDSPHMIPPVGEPVRLPQQHVSPVIPANNSSLPYNQTPSFFNDPNGGAERSSLPLPPRKTPLVEPLPPGVDPEDLDNSLTSPTFPLVPCLPGPMGTTLGPRLPPAPPCNATVQPPLPPGDPSGLNYPRPPHFGNPFPSPNMYHQPMGPQFCPPPQQPQMSGYQHPYGGVGEHYLANSTANQASFGNVPRHHNPAEWPPNWRPRPWGSNNEWNEQEQARRQEYQHSRGGDRNWRLKDKRKHYQSYEGSNENKRRKHD